MTAAGKSNSSLHIEECNFTQLVQSKIFYLVRCFSCMNYYLTAKYRTKKRIAKKFFSNFNLQKHRRILLCCLRSRTRINGTTFNMVLFLILPQLLFSFMLPLRGSVLFEIIASPDKSHALCGTEMRESCTLRNGNESRALCGTEMRQSCTLRKGNERVVHFAERK